MIVMAKYINNELSKNVRKYQQRKVVVVWRMESESWHKTCKL